MGVIRKVKREMLIVTADPARKLLVLKFSRHVGSHEVKRHAEEVDAALALLQPGFRLLTDLSELESMEYASAPLISRTMDKVNAKGVASVVRVIPDARKDIGFKMMSYFHYGKKVGIVTCETVEEANAALDS